MTPELGVQGKARLGQVVHKKTATALALTVVKNEDQREFAKLVESVKQTYNDGPRVSWGGGIMGPKSQVWGESDMHSMMALADSIVLSFRQSPADACCVKNNIEVCVCRPRPASGRRRSLASWQCVLRGGSLQCAGVQLQPLSWRLGAREVAQMLQHNWIAPLHRVPCQPHPRVATNEVPAERPSAMIPFPMPYSRAGPLHLGFWSFSWAGHQLLSTQ